jgi:thiopeptide-type bacteriocin biosynthesis protein
MVQHINCKWLSCNIYIEDEFDSFVKEYIAKVYEVLFRNKLITLFFFIRYNDGKFHFRLRMFLQSKYEIKVKEIIKEELKNYNNKSISIDGFKIYKDKRLSNLKFDQYIPETNRYGGIELINYAEIMFNLSTSMVIEFFKMKNNSSLYNSKIEAVIIFHFTLICEVYDFRIDKIKEQLKFSYTRWITYYNQDYKDENKDSIGSKIKSLEAVVDSNDITEFSKLIELSYQIHKEDDLNSFDSIFANWIKGTREYVNMLNKSSIDEISKFNIIDSLMHMMNNRFGISNNDESFLYFLLFKTLK